MLQNKIQPQRNDIQSTDKKEGKVLPEKKLIDSLYDIAVTLIDVLFDSKHRERLLTIIDKAEKEYKSLTGYEAVDAWLDRIRQFSRYRDQDIATFKNKVLEVIETEKNSEKVMHSLALQKAELNKELEKDVEIFLHKGNWTSTSANTKFFKFLIEEATHYKFESLREFGEPEKIIKRLSEIMVELMGPVVTQNYAGTKENYEKIKSKEELLAKQRALEAEEAAKEKEQQEAAKKENRPEYASFEQRKLRIGLNLREIPKSYQAPEPKNIENTPLKAVKHSMERTLMSLFAAKKSLISGKEMEVEKSYVPPERKKLNKQKFEAVAKWAGQHAETSVLIQKMDKKEEIPIKRSYTPAERKPLDLNEKNIKQMTAIFAQDVDVRGFEEIDPASIPAQVIAEVKITPSKEKIRPIENYKEGSTEWHKTKSQSFASLSTSDTFMVFSGSPEIKKLKKLTENLSRSEGFVPKDFASKRPR